ncbi:MAG: hypothetical protein KJO20_04625, partial [Eudoraea sp.]|nr:hypothetical protein [Eudoraea sp.]
SFTLPETERPNGNSEQSVETAMDQENTGPLFELGFELDPEYGAEAKRQDEKEDSSTKEDTESDKFLSHFIALSHKILEKIYG